MAQGPPTLRELKLEVTHRCPLDCLHCSSEAGPHSTRSMPFEQGMALVKQAVDMQVEEVILSGGEPLLWDGLADLVQVCSNAGVRATVYTCGNGEGIENSIRRVKDAGAQRIVFSIFAGSPRMHDNVTRTAGSFRRSLRTVDLARKARLQVEFHFVPMSHNYGELPNVVRIAARKGASRVSVLRFVPQGRGAISSYLLMSREQTLRLRRLIRTARTKMDVRLGSPWSILLMNDHPICAAATDTLSIGPDLTIHPCDAFKGIAASEIVHTEQYSRAGDWPLAVCWEKSPYLAAIREDRASPIANICLDCPSVQKCGSGCLAQKVIQCGTLAQAREARDPMCLRS